MSLPNAHLVLKPQTNYMTLRHSDAVRLLAAMPALGAVCQNANGALGHFYVPDRLLNDAIDLCVDRGWCAHITLAGGGGAVWITDDGEMAQWRCVDGRPVLDVDFVLDLLQESKDIHAATTRLVAITHPDVRHRTERTLYGKCWPDDAMAANELLIALPARSC